MHFSLFVNELPVETLLRLWDTILILQEEGFSMAIKFAVALVKLNENRFSEIDDPEKVGHIYLAILDVRVVIYLHILKEKIELTMKTWRFQLSPTKPQSDSRKHFH